MLVEKFDFIELLRLAIAQGKAEGKKNFERCSFR